MNLPDPLRMSAESAPKRPESPAAKKTHQELCADAIIAGDLDLFKKLSFRQPEINQPILPHRTLDLGSRPVNVRGPTLLILAVECERLDIMVYILEHKSPDLSATSAEGFNVVHIASWVKDSRPLQHLIQYAWVQEHIDDPIALNGQTPRAGCQNTALHIAVTNRNVPHLFLLLSPFPPSRESSASDAPVISYDPANVDQPAASGSTALHIAVHCRCVPIVRILRAFGADYTVQNARGSTALECAQALKAANDSALAQRRARFAAENRAYAPPAAPDPIDRVVAALEGTPENPDELIGELAPELVPPVPIAAPADEPDGERSRRRGPGGQQLQEVLQRVNEIDARLKRMEAAGFAAPHAVAAIACACGADGDVCGQCRTPFCDSCRDKPAHACTRG